MAWCYLRQYGASAVVCAASGFALYTALHWPHTKFCKRLSVDDAAQTNNMRTISKWDSNWDM